MSAVRAQADYGGTLDSNPGHDTCHLSRVTPPRVPARLTASPPRQPAAGLRCAVLNEGY